MTKVIVVALLSLVACAGDDEPLPTCESIDADHTQDALECDAQGSCKWGDEPCCEPPRPGAEIAPSCVGVIKPLCVDLGCESALCNVAGACTCNGEPCTFSR